MNIHRKVGVRAVLQALAFFEWYSVKSREEGLKLDLLKVPMGQWGAFFLLVFLGQVHISVTAHIIHNESSYLLQPIMPGLVFVVIQQALLPLCAQHCMIF